MPELTQLEKRINVKEILRDPGLRRAMLVPALQAIQHREGVMTTREQAEAAYAKILGELQNKDGCREWPGGHWLGRYPGPTSSRGVS